MNEDIKPKMVDGKPLCNSKCPSFNNFTTTKMIQSCDILSASKNEGEPKHWKVHVHWPSECWPYYRARVAELEAKIERLRDATIELSEERISIKRLIEEVINKNTPWGMQCTREQLAQEIMDVVSPEYKQRPTGD